MASKPGILTDWPWKPLGSFKVIYLCCVWISDRIHFLLKSGPSKFFYFFGLNYYFWFMLAWKYVILVPWVVHSICSFPVKGEIERDLTYFLIFPLLLTRMLHNQIWVSLSRYVTAKGNNRIVDKGLEFEQVDRERNWDDQILFQGILLYIGYQTIPQANYLPMWRTDGVIMTILLHVGPVEFLYYWFHRALHHHFLYSRYHSHHHSSIVTEPISSVIHPFAEQIVYYILFTIPLYTTLLTQTASIVSFSGYVTFIDFMNNMGHCNFEFIPKLFFSIFPPLKYLMYTPSYHSLHHTQFRTNYCLFMPIYDYIYGTMDKSSDTLYETSLERQEESPDVVHLTHLTTPESIYHLRFGFASLASKPLTSKWYLWVMWPFTCWCVILTWIYGHTFVLERNTFKNLNLQSWVIPRYNVQHFAQWRREAINSLIEESVLEADKRGVKVLSLGLLNQGEELNRSGELYIQRHPQLKIKVVDGSSLAAAIVLHSLPQGTTQVLLGGNLTKVANAIAFALCEMGIQVATIHKHEYEKLKLRLGDKANNKLVLSTSYDHKTWLVGDGLTEKEQTKASKGTLFIPFSQFPPKRMLKDCFYHTTPAMIIPKSFENMHSCENWLPRRVMSAWRIAGIVHALEGWNINESGDTMCNIEQVWQATLQHGFRPLMIPAFTKPN